MQGQSEEAFWRVCARRRTIQIIRHPDLAGGIREVASHRADVLERILEVFWRKLDQVLNSSEKPQKLSFWRIGERIGGLRANFRRFLHLIYYAGWPKMQCIPWC